MPTSINGSTGGGGASAPAGTGVVTASGGAFVDPVPSAATTRATLGLGTAAVAALSDATPIVESGAGSAGTSGNVARADHVHPAAGGGGGTWLSLYGGTALWLGGDSAFGFASVDRVSASAGAAAPAFGPGQSMVVVLYPGATPTGSEIIASHINSSSSRGFYVSVGSNAGARRRIGLFLSGLNGSTELFLTGSDFTVGAPYAIAICVKADKSVRYSVNGAAVATIAALSGSYNTTTSSDTLHLGSTTTYTPTFYPLVSALIGAARWYSTELSDADLVAACAGVATASIPTVATGTVSADFSAAAFAGNVRVVAASPTPTWIAAGNPAVRGV
jgi:hypothetical protein